MRPMDWFMFFYWLGGDDRLLLSGAGLVLGHRGGVLLRERRNLLLVLRLGLS